MSRIQLIVFIIGVVALAYIALPFLEQKPAVEPAGVNVPSAAAAKPEKPAKPLKAGDLVISKVRSFGGREEDDREFTFSYTIENKGESPAYQISISFQPWYEGLDFANKAAEGQIAASAYASMQTKSDYVPKLLPGEVIKREVKVGYFPGVGPRRNNAPVKIVRYSPTP